jgi:hypothetical protein
MATKLKSLRKNVDKLSTGMIKEAGIQAAKLSPYRSGENASNIHPAVGNQKPKHEPLANPISRAAAINKTRSRMLSWKPPVNAKVLSLVATADYALYLELGSSKQAPTGFLRNAVRRARSKTFR